MDVRKKLVELLGKVQDYGTKNTCEGWSVTVECKDNETIADHLIAHGVTVQEWISVKDRLPEDDLPKNTKKKMIRCLVYTDKGTVKPCVRQRWEHFDGKLLPWMWNKDLFAKPTHWMYYPQPPKGE
jgi:hypothetical protein